MAANHQSVDWRSYFKSIRRQCPWAYTAYLNGLIDITEYTGHVIPLGDYEARVYTVDAPNHTVEALADSLDRSDANNEWLFSYPGYGIFAAPVSILIQQDRAKLKQLREKLNASA